MTSLRSGPSASHFCAALVWRVAPLPVPICGQGSGIIRADKAPLRVTFASAKLPASSSTEESRWCRSCHGIGTVSGSMRGALVLGVPNLVLANLSVDSQFIQITKETVLLLAVAFDVCSKQQGRASFTGMVISGLNRTSSPPRQSLLAALRPLRVG